MVTNPLIQFQQKSANVFFCNNNGIKYIKLKKIWISLFIMVTSKKNNMVVDDENEKMFSFKHAGIKHNIWVTWFK